MESIQYCGVCTMPPEYCRYSPKYDKCLEWMKKNLPDLFAIEIKDISERNPKIAKKTQHLWDENAPSPEEQKEAQTKNKKSRKRNKKKKNNQDKNEEYTKSVQIIENKVYDQQQIANDQMADIQSKMSALSTNTNSSSSSPSKSILKNPNNPNFEQERQKLAAASNENSEDSDIDGLNDQYMRRGGNMNKARGPPPRKLTKQRKGDRRRGKQSRGKNKRKKGRDESDEEEENKENEDEEKEKQQTVRFYEQNKNKKVPKAAVQVELQTKKGNKKVTVVRGFLEKSPEKEQRIKSEFMKKFATSVTITFQHPGSDKGPKQVVLMGDKRYDFMKYLDKKFPKAKKLLYYKSKRFGMTPAVNPTLGCIMPPP